MPRPILQGATGVPDMTIAKIAVSGVRYSLDRPYDYTIPEELSGRVRPGMRVVVPFSRANRPAEGVVLALAEQSAYEKLKPVARLLDEEPVLDEKQLKLALWMRERFFCTVWEAVKALLPAGLWYKNGRRRVTDKTVDMVSLAVPAEEALDDAARRRARAPQQAEILTVLASVGRVSVGELREFTGAPLQSVRALEKAGLLLRETEEVFRRPEHCDGPLLPPPELTEAQRAALEGISALADGKKAAAALLFGVTGSGKTTVYLSLIARMLEAGKSAVLLVPEIALTPQMLRLFSSHFGDAIAVLHSSLSSGERYDEWKRIRRGDARVVIGTRSAVFAPVQHLGLIILDEEQEDTYKSENAPRYHARDVAKFRCAQENALLLLGSATPDVESRYWAETGRYGFFTLPGRYNEMALPRVEIADMKTELRAGNGGAVSALLRGELERNLELGEQSILFLNRRGANRLVTCGECGFTYRCPRCSVSLTYHSFGRKLLCHYCGYTRPLDDACPDCGGALRFVGEGTQKVEEELGLLFPGVPVLRMDTDTVTPAGGHDVLLRRFQEQRIPIMVGTQMVTKGLNFENVTLVGVLSADQSLYAGDYRAGERTFDLITQVIGRSGRFERPGRAVIQTFTPENQIIRQAADQDYERFYAAEIELRRLQLLPPFTEILTLTAAGPDETQTLSCAADIRACLARAIRGRTDARVLGPAPLAVLRVRDSYRYRVTLCAPPGSGLRRAVAEAAAEFSTDKKYRRISVYADNNPLD